MKKSDIHRRQFSALAEKWLKEALELEANARQALLISGEHTQEVDRQWEQAKAIRQCRRELLNLGDSICGGM